MIKKSALEMEATKLLRESGFTWAGNVKSDELIFTRQMERIMKVPGGKSTKQTGIISPRFSKK